MISARALGALRVAASLTDGVPHLRARVRFGDGSVLDVRDPDDGAAHDPGVLRPCAFRAAVGDLHQELRHGVQLAVGSGGRTPAPRALLPADLLTGADPAIDIGTPSCGAARPGGLYRVPSGTAWLWACGTTLDATVAFDLGRTLVSTSPALGRLRNLGLRPDPVTDVCLLFAETDAAPGSAEEHEVVDLLESLLARWTAHELVVGALGGHPGVHDPRVDGSS